MNESVGCLPMSLAEDNSENVKYTVPSMPIRAVASAREDYPQLSVVNHWHNDFEFTLVTDGHMFYSVNGERTELNTGDMIFVNSARMHYGYWEKKENCKFICVLFGLRMLSAVPDREIRKLAGNDAPPYIPVRHNDINVKGVADSIKNLYEMCNQKSEGYEIKAAALCCEAAYGIFGLFADTAYHSPEDMKKLSAVHAMTGYIQGHFSETLTLADIAAAGSVCRSRCCELFKEYVGKTPMEHLNEYRISKSIDLLNETDMSVTEIAEKCGFNSSSYFAEVFRKTLGSSPMEFRRKCS